MRCYKSCQANGITIETNGQFQEQFANYHAGRNHEAQLSRANIREETERYRQEFNEAHAEYWEMNNAHQPPSSQEKRLPPPESSVDESLASLESRSEKALTQERAQLIRAADQEKQAEHLKKSCNPAITGIVVALTAIAGLAVAFLLKNSPIYYKKLNNPNDKSPKKDAQAPYSFAISSGYFQGVYTALLGGISPHDGWTGDSSADYKTGTAGFTRLVADIACLGQQVDNIVQTQAQQVSDSRDTLANTFDGLQLAMPVSESLYCSGPAGPALSCNFQLAVANSAVGTGIDTTNTMHNNAQQHKAHLITLGKQYDEALTTINRLLQSRGAGHHQN